jgi:uncharacterized RDD family membrane protein YckC
MPMNTSSTTRESAYPAHLGWRVLAIIYDALPMIPLLFVTSIALLLLHGGKPVRPASLLSYLEIPVYWGIVGLYAVTSWRRGGQTMGMRPWRLLVVSQTGTNASVAALWLRYAIASFTGGLALLWCLFDSQKRGLHDIAAGTLVVRKLANASVEKEKNSMPST